MCLKAQDPEIRRCRHALYLTDCAVCFFFFSSSALYIILMNADYMMRKKFKRHQLRLPGILLPADYRSTVILRGTKPTQRGKGFFAGCHSDTVSLPIPAA